MDLQDFNSGKYIKQLETKFGEAARKELERTTAITLKRKILGD